MVTASATPIQDTPVVVEDVQECDFCGRPGAERETHQDYVGGHGYVFLDVWACPDGCGEEPDACPEHPAGCPTFEYEPR